MGSCELLIKLSLEGAGLDAEEIHFFPWTWSTRVTESYKLIHEYPLDYPGNFISRIIHDYHECHDYHPNQISAVKFIHVFIYQISTTVIIPWIHVIFVNHCYYVYQPLLLSTTVIMFIPSVYKLIHVFHDPFGFTPVISSTACWSCCMSCPSWCEAGRPACFSEVGWQCKTYPAW